MDPTDARPGYRGPLLALVPADATYVVRARPAILYARPAFRTVADPLFPPARLRSFDERTGVDLTSVEDAVYVRLDDDGFLIAARVERAHDVAVAAGMRMNGIEAEADRPFVRRLGYMGTELREVVAVGDDLILIGAGAGPQIAELLRGLAGGSPPPGLFASGEARRLAGFHPRAPLHLYAPRPLGLPLDTGIGLLLARERAACIALDPHDEHLNIWALVLAELPPGGEDNIRQLLHSVARSDLGTVLGIDRALGSLEIDVSGDRARVGLRWPSRPLARGLRVLFVDELEALLDEPVFAE